MIKNLGSIRIKSIWQNPIWLIFSSLVIFSLLILLLLIYHRTLFPPTKVALALPKTTNTPTQSLLSISIPILQSRIYSSASFTKVQEVVSGGKFTSEIISYIVDGFVEYALLDIPTTVQPTGGFPVVIVDHGYIVPSQYSTVSSYAGETNFFANNGYIVLKPDYRGNGNSEGTTDALQRYNYPVDVMTLLASVRNIPQANSSKIYLWGHSMGGEVTLTVIEILGKQPDLGKNVKAVVLWAPVTDPAKWFEKPNINKIPEALLTPFPYTKTFEILGQPSDDSPIWQSINPLNYLSAISQPIQLNHGTSDESVPYSWSIDLKNKLQSAGKNVSLISYPGADHNLSPQTAQALQNSLQFFKDHQ